jgi:MFS family permease
LSLLGDTALWLALGIWAKDLTGSSGAAGLVIFCIAAPQLLAPVSGMVADRVRRRALLLVVNLATLAAVLPLLAVHDRSDVWILYAVATAYGVSYSLIGPAQSALLATLLPEDLLADANSLLQTVREALRLVAPLAGAGLYALAGGAAVALLDAATFALAAASVAALRVREPRPRREHEPWTAAVVAGARHISRTIPLRQITIAGAITLLTLGFSETLLFAIADDGLHRPVSFVGVLMAAQGVGAIAGALTCTRAIRRFGEVRASGLGLAVFAAGAALTAAPALVAVLAGKALFGFGLPWIVIPLLTLLQRLTPSHLQGRAYSAAELLLSGPQTLSIAAGAALISVVDYRVLIAAEALAGAIAAAYLLKVSGASGTARPAVCARGARSASAP